MQVCPKCQNQTLAVDFRGVGIYERHVHCYTCGLLHVRGAAQDSIKRQLNPAWWEKEQVRRLKNAVKIVAQD